MARRRTHEDPELGALTLDRLTRDLWVEQRAQGHRFSSDDMVTAFVAVEQAPAAGRVLDLGCGLGSVLLHLAWSLPRAELVGVEAQAVSFALLKRNLARSGLADRVRIHAGDLRDPEVVQALAQGGPFDLITGTPPYFPPGSALDAEDTQRAYARIEYRGGVEAYLSTAAQVLHPKGLVVLCGDSEAEPRVLAAALPLGLSCHGLCEVLPREGQRPLFSVWSLGFVPQEVRRRRLVLRDAQGARTADAEALRAFSGFAG